MKEEKFNL